MPKAKNAARKVGSKAKTSKKSKPAAGGMKKAGGEGRKIRFRPGTVALRHIKKYQKSTDLLLPRAPFQRLVRRLSREHQADLRFSVNALMAL